MKLRHIFSISLVWIFCIALAGCMKLGPDYQRPDTGIVIPAQFLEAQKGQTAEYVDQDRWWEIFGDSRLNRIVSTVLANNPEIAQAAAGVMEARAVMVQTRADQYPSIDASFQASRQQQSIVDQFTGQNISVKTDTFRLAFPAAFELDLWGRLARATEAARADLMAAEDNRRTIAQSLVAETVSIYLQIRSLKQQITLNRDLVRTYEQNLELVEERYRLGIASVLDVYQARRMLAQAEAQLPPFLESKGKARHSLAVLQGKYPENNDPEISADWAFEVLPPIPAGLPAELLNRRPDIRLAEAALIAASARIGVAKANRFPQISLTGNFGYISNELNMLLDHESELWQLVGAGLQPVFDAGKRSAGQKAAEARYGQRLEAYAKIILNAFAEVEGALLSRKQQLELRKRLIRLMSEAEATLYTAKDRYQRGLTDYLNVLDAQQSFYRVELLLVQNENAIYNSRVQLHRALGGGWDRISGISD